MRLYHYLPELCINDEPNFDAAYKFLSERDINAVGYPNGVYDELELQWLVQDMAKDFMENHDGWEDVGTDGIIKYAVWRLTDKDFIGWFDVMVEYEPRYNVSRSKEQIGAEE